MEDKEFTKIVEKIENIEKRLPTEVELKAFRELMEQDNRIKWFWSTARTWLLMISATVAFLTVGLDGIRSVLRKFIA